MLGHGTYLFYLLIYLHFIVTGRCPLVTFYPCVHIEALNSSQYVIGESLLLHYVPQLTLGHSIKHRLIVCEQYACWQMKFFPFLNELPHYKYAVGACPSFTEPAFSPEVNVH
jgi:hypothetical protein